LGSTKRKVMVYIDGLNFDSAIHERKWQRFLWLDLVRFSRRCLKEEQTLIKVKYFTSRLVRNASDQKHQNTYLDALETLKDLEIYYGNFNQEIWICNHCGKGVHIHHEKQTDVNLAIHLLADAEEDAYDDAVLITADSDQVPVIKIIKRRHPSKRVILFLPPGRQSLDLARAIVPHPIRHFSPRDFADSQLPPEVLSKTEFKLARPKAWTQ